MFSLFIRKTDNFMRPYNFSTLPQGNYTIELSDGQSRHVEKVNHSLSSANRAVKIVRLSKDENRYLLAVPNRGHDLLTIRIFDERQALLFEGREVINGDFAKVYNLNGVKGTQVFQVTDQAGRISRQVESSER